MKNNIKKAKLNDRVHLLEMTLIRLSESFTKIIERVEILSKNQQKIIDTLTADNEVSEDIDEAQSTGI